MRFEQPVSNLVAKYPELQLNDAGLERPCVTQENISAAVALGRRLHGKFWREKAMAIFGRPARAVIRRIASEQTRRATVRALGELDDRLLRDIGIERCQIPFVARALTYGEPHTRAVGLAGTEPTAADDTPRINRAA